MEKNPSRLIEGTWFVIGITLFYLVMVLDLSTLHVGVPQSRPLIAVSVTVFVASILLLPFFYKRRKRYLDGVRQHMEGNHWVHWQYAISEWRKYEEVEWKRSRTAAFMLPFGVVAVALLLASLSGWSWNRIQLFIPMFVAFALFVGVLMYAFGRLALFRNSQTPGEVYIGKDGIYFNSKDTVWNITRANVGEVKIPKEIPITLQVRVISGAIGFGTSEVRIPIPVGREQEAREIVGKFSAKN